MSKFIFSLIILVGVFISCNPEGPKLEPLDLLSYGLPLKIMAPAESVVKFDDLGIMKDVTIKKDDHFNVQIFVQNAPYLDQDRLLKEQKELVEAFPYFSEIKQEDKDGFIFEKKIDENYINYDFRKVKIRGDQQYIFRTSLVGKFTIEQVKIMYNAVD